jgi:hypothetical protein
MLAVCVALVTCTVDYETIMCDDGACADNGGLS